MATEHIVRFARTTFLSATVLFSLVANSAPTDGEFMSLNGNWKWQGYDRILSISGDQFEIKTISTISCLTYQSGSLAELGEQLDRVEREGPNHFSAYDRGGFNNYRFHKLAALPTSCGKVPKDDPVTTFAIFSKYFSENYAFFEKKGIDWNARVAAHRTQVTAKTSDTELFAVLSDMVKDLHDGHVNILAGPYESIFDPNSNVPFFNAEQSSVADTIVQRMYEAQKGDADGIVAKPAFEKKFTELAAAHINSVVLKGKHHTAANDLLVWGETSPGVGYLAVHGMAGLAGQESDTNLAGDIAKLSDILDNQVLPFLADKKAAIVDVRFNGGGYDAVSLAIAGRFADNKRLAFTKQAMDKDGMAPVQQVFVEPKGAKQFTKPVYLLVSNKTGSAAEIFTLGMMVLPHVTRIGESTNGILSDMWVAPLPKGWLVSLSNETYLTPEGVSYEGVGIPPQIEVPVFVEGAFWENVDKAIETADALAR